MAQHSGLVSIGEFAYADKDQLHSFDVVVHNEMTHHAFADSIPYQTHLPTQLWGVFLPEGLDLFVIVVVSIIWVYRGMPVGMPDSVMEVA